MIMEMLRESWSPPGRDEPAPLSVRLEGNAVAAIAPVGHGCLLHLGTLWTSHVHCDILQPAGAGIAKPVEGMQRQIPGPANVCMACQAGPCEHAPAQSTALFKPVPEAAMQS